MKYKLSDLRKGYDRAIEKKETQFTFDGHELVVGYAKYLIEYLETEYNRRGLKENVPFFEFKGMEE